MKAFPCFLCLKIAKSISVFLLPWGPDKDYIGSSISFNKYKHLGNEFLSVIAMLLFMTIDAYDILHQNWVVWTRYRFLGVSDVLRHHKRTIHSCGLDSLISLKPLSFINNSRDKVKWTYSKDGQVRRTHGLFLIFITSREEGMRPITRRCLNTDYIQVFVMSIVV